MLQKLSFMFKINTKLAQLPSLSLVNMKLNLNSDGLHIPIFIEAHLSNKHHVIPHLLLKIQEDRNFHICANTMTILAYNFHGENHLTRGGGRNMSCCHSRDNGSIERPRKNVKARL